MKDILEFKHIEVNKKILNHALLWDAKIYLMVNKVSSYIKGNSTVAIFFQGRKIAQSDIDEYGHAYIELINLPLPQNRANQVFVARLSNSTLEATSKPFSLEFIHSNTKQGFKKIVTNLLDWIEDNIISHTKRNIIIGVMTLGVWFVLLFWIFIFTKTLKGVFKWL